MLIYRMFANVRELDGAAALVPTKPKRSRSSSCATSWSCCNAAPRGHGCAGPTERSSPRWPGCCRHDVASACWSPRRRSCAGTANSPPAAGPPTRPTRPTRHPRRRPRPGPASGEREPHLGLPARARRTRQPRLPDRRLHRLENPQRRRDRPRTSPSRTDLGAVPQGTSARDPRLRPVSSRHDHPASALRVLCHRARHPPGAHPGRHRTPDWCLAHPTGPQPARRAWPLAPDTSPEVDLVRQGGCRSCLHHTRRSSAGAPSNWPVWASNRSRRSRRNCGSPSLACGTGWRKRRRRAGNGGSSSRLTSDEKRELAQLRRTSAAWRSRMRSSSVPPRISPGRTSSQSSVPAGP